MIVASTNLMPTYTLVPDEHDFEPEERVAASPGELLAMVYDCGWNSAQVFEGSKFLFVLARNPSGVWAILPGLPSAPEHSGA